MQKLHVVVVGAGLIGLSAAYALLRDGHRVTIVEPDVAGGGAAKGNAGEFTPQQVAPLASSNTARDIIRGVFTRSSYLSISPSRLPVLAGFGLRFLRAARNGRSARSSAALAQFTQGILPALQRMAGDGIDISGGGEGFLMTSSNETELADAHRNYRLRAAQGWGEAPGEILRGAKLAAQEPALHPSVAGGFVLPGEFSLDPVTFVDSLAARVIEMGAQVELGLSAHRVGEGANITCIDASGVETDVRGDRIVVAAGAWTTPILRRSGIPSAAIVSGKGYSYTVPIDSMPRQLIHAMDRHCVVIPMHERLRIVGMMEFDGQPRRFNADRVSILTRAAAGVIAGGRWADRVDEWVGARPMTADGMPLLGAVQGRPEVIVAAGHNMHGLSLGPVTGEVVANIVGDRTTVIGGAAIDLSPFAVKR